MTQTAPSLLWSWKTATPRSTRTKLSWTSNWSRHDELIDLHPVVYEPEEEGTEDGMGEEEEEGE
jgi:hypothetical protein